MLRLAAAAAFLISTLHAQTTYHHLQVNDPSGAIGHEVDGGWAGEFPDGFDRGTGRVVDLEVKGGRLGVQR